MKRVIRQAVQAIKDGTLTTRVSVQHAECTVVSSSPITCPLCGANVPANRTHKCKRTYKETAR